MEFNKIIDLIRYAILIWLAIEFFLTAYFFHEVYNRGKNLPIFKIKERLFTYSGAQYMIGFFIGLIITLIPNPTFIFILRAVSLIFGIPLIRAIRAYRNAFISGDAELTTPQKIKKEGR